MDNAFRIKKFREPSKSKSQDIVSGTLDSVHQSIIGSIKDSTLNIDELRKRTEELEDELEKTTEMYRVTKLQEELTSIKAKIEEADPLVNYFVRNADIMIKYYSDSDKKQAISCAPGDQRTFMKYLAPSSADTNNHSKKKTTANRQTRVECAVFVNDLFECCVVWCMVCGECWVVLG
jgi:vacuolar-type H+-ATPase subunit I/STV1